MNVIISKVRDKLFFKKWIIGIFRADINEIIRRKTLDQDITWLMKNPRDTFYADPFLLSADDEKYRILLESFSFAEKYGKISLLKLDKHNKLVDNKVLLDTKSHLSYPFVFAENNQIHIFPEARQSGKLSCYLYDPVKESLDFLCDILELPLLDSTILKKDDKYWIFGSLPEKERGYDLNVFYSDNLLGPYVPHPGNPVKNGINGTRSAGNFIEVDGVTYRPSQNCEKEYGESISINKVTILTETEFNEEPYMTISINREKRSDYGMHTIHTINSRDGIIVVDGIRWFFEPVSGLKNYFLSKLKRNNRVKTDVPD